MVSFKNYILYPHFLLLFLFFPSSLVKAYSTCSSSTVSSTIPNFQHSLGKLYPVNSSAPYPPIYDHQANRTMLEISLMDPLDFHSSFYKKHFERRRHFLEIVQIAQKHHSTPPICRSKLESYYKSFSPWKDFSQEDKLAELYKKTHQIYSSLQLDEALYNCFVFDVDNHYSRIKEDIRSFYLSEIQKNKIKMGNIFTYFTKNSLKKIPVRPFSLLSKKKSIYLRWPVSDFNEKELSYQFSKKYPKKRLEDYLDYLLELTWPIFRLSLERRYLLELKNFITLEGLVNPFFSKILLGHNSLFSCGLLSDVLQKYITITIPSSPKESKGNPYKLHKKLHPNIIRCIASQESHTLNPMEANYTFCAADERVYMRSSAIGLGQTTFRTFNWLRSISAIPLEEDGVLNPMSEADNQFLFESIPSNIDMQIKIIFYHINYLLQRTNNAHQTIIKYDTDDQSRYIKNVTRCMNCLQKNNSTDCIKKMKGGQ